MRRSLLGYRRADVDAALAERDVALARGREELERKGAELDAAAIELLNRDRRLDELEQVATMLSERVVMRERELREVRAELARVRENGDAGLAALAAIAAELEEVRRQARGQATRMRLRALRDAAELSERANGDRPERAAEVFQGAVEVEVGPFKDFSQLLGFEDAVKGIGGAGEIAVKRFSRGRATVAMSLAQPVELLRELEERCDLEFRVRDLRSDRLVLDVGAAEAA